MVVVTLVFVWVVRRERAAPLPSPADLLQLRPAPNQLVVLGLDGASWSQLLPLLDSGRLPTLSRLMQHGSYGHLNTLLPTVSPSIWTSVATGKRPEKHGITDFTVREEENGRLAPATGRMRKSLALWNLFSAYRIPVGVVNWWTTWPAEPVEGFILTDLAASGRRKQLEEKDHWEDLRGSTGGGTAAYYPPALRQVEGRLESESVTVVDLLRFADLAAEDHARLEALQSFETGNPLSVLKFSYLADRYYSDMTQALLAENPPPELLLYYTSSTDALAHTLWKFTYPEEGAPGVEAGLQGRYGRTLERYYEWLDSHLERILAHYPDDVNVILLSDHGMIGMPDVTSGVKHLISARHSDHALVMVSGRDFQKNQVFATRRIEGENFERWDNSINYQERGYRNLFPGGWMETVVITPEGESELRVDFKAEAEGPAALQVRWDGSVVGTLEEASTLTLAARRGLHRLRLEYPPDSGQSLPVHPPAVPWTASELGRERPRPLTPGEDWGYALWQDGDIWRLRWTAYQGRLFELDPVFSGRLTCEEGFEKWASVPESGDAKIDVQKTVLGFEHRLDEGKSEGGIDFVPRGPVTFDLLIDGDRYPRMVYLRPFSRIQVDAITLTSAGEEASSAVPSVLDVAPTALALFGLPAAEDMDGRVWTEHLRPEALSRCPSEKIASYEVLPRECLPEPPARDEALDKEQMKRLEAFGYLFGSSPESSTPSL